MAAGGNLVRYGCAVQLLSPQMRLNFVLTAWYTEVARTAHAHGDRGGGTIGALRVFPQPYAALKEK